MIYTPELYARAFIETVYLAPEGKQKKLLSRFLEAVIKNGDWPWIEKIFQKIAEMVVNKKSGRIVVLEFARDVEKQLVERLKSCFPEKDRVSVFLRPELAAGVRVLLNEERELDMSLQRKLKLFFK